MPFVHTFAGNPLDRADARRRDAQWLSDAARSDEARFLPMHQLNVLVESLGGTPHLGWLGADALRWREVDLQPVFLGIDNAGAPHFAQDISAVHDPSTNSICRRAGRSRSRAGRPWVYRASKRASSRRRGRSWAGISEISSAAFVVAARQRGGISASAKRVSGALSAHGPGRHHACRRW